MFNQDRKEKRVDKEVQNIMRLMNRRSINATAKGKKKSNVVIKDRAKVLVSGTAKSSSYKVSTDHALTVKTLE